MSVPATGLPVVGMVGGGQLARMTHQAAVALGVELRVLAETRTDSAALVCPGTVVGDYRSYDDLAAFAAGCDVLTFDHEHVPLPLLSKLADAGVAVRPGPHALPSVQDKIQMRRRLGSLGIPVPAWRAVDTVAEVVEFAAGHGWPVVAKAASGGYDGKGVWALPDAAAAADVVGHADAAGLRLFVEGRVPFDRELAALVARSAGAAGGVRAWPVVETVQVGGVCDEVLAPAPALPATIAAAAEETALRIAEALDVVGVLAVELFQVGDGLVVNELAMRPHNSGHWTIDGAVTSQFEQHLRAVLGWPLGGTTPTAPAVAMANVLGGSPPTGARGPSMTLAGRLSSALVDPEVHVHLYAKGLRPGRKIGHVTVCGIEPYEVRRRARRAADALRGPA